MATIDTARPAGPPLPEIYLLAAICVVLLVDVFVGRRASAAVTFALSLLRSPVTCVASPPSPTSPSARSAVRRHATSPIRSPALLKLVRLTAPSRVAFLYSREYLQRARHPEGRVLRARRCPRCSASCVLVSANSLLTVYLGVELLSLSLYAMVAFDRDSASRPSRR